VHEFVKATDEVTNAKENLIWLAIDLCLSLRMITIPVGGKKAFPFVLCIEFYFLARED